MTASEFKQRFIPHSAAMYRTAFRLTANTQEAEDMVQEAFIRLWNRREHIPPTDDLAAYCCAVTHNVCIDARRRHQPDTSPTLLETLSRPVRRNSCCTRPLTACPKDSAKWYTCGTSKSVRYPRYKQKPASRQATYGCC